MGIFGKIYPTKKPYKIRGWAFPQTANEWGFSSGSLRKKIFYNFLTNVFINLKNNGRCQENNYICKNIAFNNFKTKNR